MRNLLNKNLTIIIIKNIKKKLKMIIFIHEFHFTKIKRIEFYNLLQWEKSKEV